MDILAVFKREERKLEKRRQATAQAERCTSGCKSIGPFYGARSNQCEQEARFVGCWSSGDCEGGEKAVGEGHGLVCFTNHRDFHQVGCVSTRKEVVDRGASRGPMDRLHLFTLLDDHPLMGSIRQYCPYLIFWPSVDRNASIPDFREQSTVRIGKVSDARITLVSPVNLSTMSMSPPTFPQEYQKSKPSLPQCRYWAPASLQGRSPARLRSFGNPRDPRRRKSLILGRAKGCFRTFGNYPFSKRPSSVREHS